MDDLLHRNGGPAYVSYRPDGSVEGEEWYQHDQLHRDDGPAVLHHSIDGSVEEHWYQHNSRLDLTPEQLRLLKDGNPLEWVLAHSESQQ